MQTRRACLKNIMAGAVSLGAAIRSQGAEPKDTIGFGQGNYGAPNVETGKAIQLIADVGYDSVELCLMPGWPTEPAKVSASQRREIRKQVGDLGLAMPSLLDTIRLLDPGHKTNLEMIRRDAQFGHDVNAGVGGVTPCIQTILGGKSEDWDSQKGLAVERLKDWAEVAKEMRMVVAFKGENLNLNDSSQRTLWLVQQVNSPWLRILYDYSHYQAGGETLADSLNRLMPYSVMISIKDGKNYTDKPGFERLLPGDGSIDYVDYFRRLKQLKYHGHVVVEISHQLSVRPGYDPVYAIKHSYSNIAPVMAKVGIVRPPHQKVKV
jgi:sugar phosphate isomerase/epimerase